MRRMEPLLVTESQEDVSVYLVSLETGVTGVYPGISLWPTEVVKVSIEGGSHLPAVHI